MRGSSILTILETSCWSGWGLSLWGGFPWKEAQCQSSRWILTLTLNLLSILAQNLNAFSFGQNNGFSIFSNLRPGWLLRDSPTTVLDILLRWRESWWFWWFSRWGPTHRTSATLLTGSYCHHIQLYNVINDNKDQHRGHPQDLLPHGPHLLRSHARGREEETKHKPFIPNFLFRQFSCTALSNTKARY